MTPTDWFLVVLVFLGLLYGILRSLRPALFAAVVLFGSLLAAALLTVPLERLILDFSGVGSENYPNAPAVAVLILEGHAAASWIAAFLPALMTVFLVFAFFIGSVLFGRYLTDPDKGVVSRSAGALIGICAGGALALLFSVQLLRLPSPPASKMFRGSLIISALNHLFPNLLTAFSGGL